LAAYPGSSISAFSNAEDALAYIMDVGTGVLIAASSDSLSVIERFSSMHATDMTSAAFQKS